MVFNNKKGLSKMIIGYLLFLFIISCALVFAVYKQNDYLDNEYVKLLDEYEVDIDNGEQLVRCENGSIDVYNPNANLSVVCGQTIFKQVEQYPKIDLGGLE